MANIQVVQEVAGTALVSTSPGTLNMTVTAGNLLHLWVLYLDIGPTITVSDSLNGSWGAATAVLSNGQGGNRWNSYALNNTLGGALTITLTTSPVNSSVGWLAIEISGQSKQSNVFNSFSSIYLPSPTNATDNVASPQAFNTTQPVLLLGLASSTGTIATGTGFATGGSAVNGIGTTMYSENKRVTDTVGTSATFTMTSGSTDANAMAVMYTEKNETSVAWIT